MKHAFRNALMPIVTVAGLQFGFLLVGTVLVEYTFGLGGLGSLLVDSVQVRDYPVVQGATVFIAGIVHRHQSDRRHALCHHRPRSARRERLDVGRRRRSARSVEPLTNALLVVDVLWRIRHNRKAVIGGGHHGFLLLLVIFAPSIAPKDPTDGDLGDSLRLPDRDYLLGADKNGRDVLSRLIYGSRTALGGAFAVVLISELIGVPIGIWAAYRGGWIDEIGHPHLGHAARVSAAVACHWRSWPHSDRRCKSVVISLGILYVPFIARVVRRVTLVQKEMAYTEAARAMGYGQATNHLPAHPAKLHLARSSSSRRSTSPTRCSISRRFRILGLGVQPPTPDWGTMLSEGQLVLLTSPHLALAAGFAIVIWRCSVSILLGDGLRDVLDPRQAQAMTLAAARESKICGSQFGTRGGDVAGGRRRRSRDRSRRDAGAGRRIGFWQERHRPLDHAAWCPRRPANSSPVGSSSKGRSVTLSER